MSAVSDISVHVVRDGALDWFSCCDVRLFVLHSYLLFGSLRLWVMVIDCHIVFGVRTLSHVFVSRTGKKFYSLEERPRSDASHCIVCGSKICLTCL